MENMGLSMAWRVRGVADARALIGGLAADGFHEGRAIALGIEVYVDGGSSGFQRHLLLAGWHG
jgi:hypothetical protein